MKGREEEVINEEFLTVTGQGGCRQPFNGAMEEVAGNVKSGRRARMQKRQRINKMRFFTNVGWAFDIEVASQYVPMLISKGPLSDMEYEEPHLETVLNISHLKVGVI